MAFCAKCGQKLAEGEVHVCNEVAASASHTGPAASTQANPIMEDLTRAVKQIDGNVVLTLLKNPQQGLKLQPSKDLMYGLLGIAASLIGFLIWAFIMQNKIEEFFGKTFGNLMMLMGGGRAPSFGSGIAWKLFLMGLLSIIAFLGAIYIIGNWIGSKKLSVTEVVVRLGGMQLTTGAGFVVVGLFTLINVSIGMSLMLILLLSTLLWTVMGANQMYEISEDRRISFITLTIALYGIVLSLLMKILM
ncbi:hypothetical protein [Paenibacillus sp. KN14-4R]|uniref:hypothetical protein n=1 Tax=Paenibacillus sp. KN14-4R TaxID=3445773 RepID=UPI003F9FB819